MARGRASTPRKTVAFPQAPPQFMSFARALVTEVSKIGNRIGNDYYLYRLPKEPPESRMLAWLQKSLRQDGTPQSLLQFSESHILKGSPEPYTISLFCLYKTQEDMKI